MMRSSITNELRTRFMNRRRGILPGSMRVIALPPGDMGTDSRSCFRYLKRCHREEVLIAGRAATNSSILAPRRAADIHRYSFVLVISRSIGP